MKRCLLSFVFLVFFITPAAQAEPPPELDYQGKILVDDIPLTGPGYFKYAISSEDAATNFWASDGTGSGEPAGFVTNTCYNGVFSTILGGAPMTDMDPGIFALDTSLFLRVWFSSDQVSFNEMLPAQDLLSAPYAMNAHMLDGLHAEEIIARATNSVTLSGDISGTPGDGTTVDRLQGGALDIGTAGAGEVLTWDGSAWTNAPVSAGMSAVVASNSFVIKTGDTMTGILGINAGPDNDLIITNSGSTIRIGRQTSATNSGVAIGPQSYANNRAVAIGGQFAYADDQGVAVGYGANAFDHGVAVGYDSQGYVSGAGVGALSEGDNQGAALGYGATGSERGAAVGYFADGREDGVAVGYQANGSYTGIAVGVSAEGDGMGIAVGYQANGRGSGVAAGNNATGFEYGIGIGENSLGRSYGIAIGDNAEGYASAVAVGSQANGSMTNIAIGVAADAQGGSERIAIGHNVTNTVDESARLRGDFYMDGGMAVYGRMPFGSGSFQRLLPLIPADNVVYVAGNGTPAGTGAIDKPLDTPQNGYDHAAAMYTNVPATVLIASGSYAGGLNMHAGNVHVAGLDRAEIADLNVLAAASFISGKQRVHNLIVKGPTAVAAGMGADVKFHNCRFEGGLQVFGPQVEVQDCFAGATAASAVTVGDGINNIAGVALYNSSFMNASAGSGTLEVNQGVSNFEVMGCQIANEDTGPCIADLEPGPIPLGQPVHLYSHNYIRGSSPGPGSTPAVADPMSGGFGPTIAFVQNTVLGHVGSNGNLQFYANNIVYGIINNVGGPGFPGWAQAGGGTGADFANNTEHEITAPLMPTSWQD